MSDITEGELLQAIQEALNGEAVEGLAPGCITVPMAAGQFGMGRNKASRILNKLVGEGVLEKSDGRAV